MAQQTIDVGAAPNDGQGDPLRTAFQYTNSNFTELYDRVQTVPPVSLVGQEGDVPGMYAYDSTYFYYCFGTWDGSTVIWAQVTQVGNISTNQIVSGNSNVVITGAGGIITVGVGGTANLAVFATTGTSVTGNVTSSGYFLGNGALLAGLPQTYANANVQAYAESGWTGNIVPSANAVYNLGSATNQWKSLYVSNTTIYLGNVPIGIGAGNVLTVNGNAVLTNGSNANISSSGNITVGAILTDGYYFANGSPFVATSSYGNANVVANLAALASNPISTSGTITAGNIGITDGSLNWANASITQTSNIDFSITGDGQVTVRSLDGTYQWTFDSAGNLTAPGNIDTSANVSASYFIGDGSQLTNLPSGNGNAISNGNSNVNIATANGPITVSYAGSANTWTFGNVDVPEALYWPDGSFQATAFVGIAQDLSNPGNATIISDSAGSAYAWSFDNTGNVIFPSNGKIVMDGGDAVIGNESDDFVIQWDNEDLVLRTLNDNIVMEADNDFKVFTDYNSGTEDYNSKWIFQTNEIVNITGPSAIVTEAGNLTLSGGRDGVASGNTIISTVDLGNAVYNWTFGNNGVLFFPNGGVIDADGNNNIELRTGNNISVEAVGAVNIYTDDGNSQWTFGSGNTLTLPGGTAVIDSSDNNIELRSNNNISMEANNVVNIYTVDGAYEFQFGDDGGFYLPNNGALVGVTANNSGYINWVGNSSGDLNGFTIMQLVPDGTLLGGDQYIILDPTAPGHIHIRAGGTQDLSGADLFLGGENSYFKVTSGANSEVEIASNSNVWNFDPTGTLTLPVGGNIVGATANNNGYQQWLGNSSGDGSGYTTLRLIPDVTLENNEQYIIIDPTGGGDIHIRPGGNIDNSNGRLILGGENSAFVVESGPNPPVKIFADENEWTFSSTGALTFPNGANILDGAFNGTASSTVSLNAVSPDGNTVSVQAQGNTSSAVISIFSNAGPVTSNWTFTTALLDPSESFLYVPPGGAISTPDASGGEGGKNIFIQAGASDPVTWNSNSGGELFIKGGYGSFGDGGGGPGGNVYIEGGLSSDSHAGNVYITTGLNNWIFDYTGNITLPGNLIAATASPAPSISGFSSINSVISRTVPVNFSTLTPVAGARAFVNDGNLVAAGNFGANISGGASNTVPVWSDGTNWYIG